MRAVSPSFRRAAILVALILAAVGPHSVALSQPEPPPAQTTDGGGQQMQDQPDMQGMASSMKDMADMCRMMMQREMQQRPYMMAAGAVLGSLLVIALVLLIVLEVQWIRFFGAKIKTERQKLG